MNVPATALSNEQVRAIVERSPSLVLAQDKPGWLELFAEGGVVQDPVGTAPNVRGARKSALGEDDLGRFWDTFIAGNEIRFEVLADYFAGSEMARDVLIHTKLSTGLQIVVPAHLLYEIDGTKIRRMRAVWDLRQRTSGALTSGWLGFKTLMAMSWKMLAVQGLGGTLAYSRGMVVGIFGAGRRTVDALVAALRAKDAAALQALFAPGAIVERPVGTRVEPKALLEALPSLTVEQVTPAGWMTSFRFKAEGGRTGLAFLEFDPASKRITSARFFGAP
ncbi:MAG TPA: hypothetical protein VGK67_29010 [Myxococcales bacterium]|jgi:hypothetical protein